MSAADYWPAGVSACPLTARFPNHVPGLLDGCTCPRVPFTAADLRRIEAALTDVAIEATRRARSRQWTGARFAEVRADLRAEGGACRELAARVAAYRAELTK